MLAIIGQWFFFVFFERHFFYVVFFSNTFEIALKNRNGKCRNTTPFLKDDDNLHCFKPFNDSLTLLKCLFFCSLFSTQIVCFVFAIEKCNSLHMKMRPAAVKGSRKKKIVTNVMKTSVFKSFIAFSWIEPELVSGSLGNFFVVLLNIFLWLSED